MNTRQSTPSPLDESSLPDDFCSSMLREVYVDLGLAEPKGHHEVTTLDGDAVVAVELVDTEGNEIDVIHGQSATPAGVRVYSNGVEFGTYMYDQKDFEKELAKAMFYSLDL
jgi:hypothetical protein